MTPIETSDCNRDERASFAGPPGSAFERIKYTDRTVHAMLCARRPLKEIVVTLAMQKEGLSKRVIELENIAPRAFSLADGRVMVWHCPDELIPCQH